MHADRARALAFEYAITDRGATSLTPFRWGTVVLDGRFPDRFDSNYLRTAGALSGVSAEQLAAEADRILGGAWCEHRKVFIDDAEAGERLAPQFLELGWIVDREVVMVHGLEPDREVDTSWVEELDWRSIRPAIEVTIRREPWGGTEEAVRMLADHRATLRETANARWFAARVDGIVASHCELYSDGRTAQIEDVATLDEYRGRGLARAVVTCAIREARVGGHDFVFLFADDDDWPKELYIKLGFQAVGVLHRFTRVPPVYAEALDLERSRHRER